VHNKLVDLESADFRLGDIEPLHRRAPYRQVADRHSTGRDSPEGARAKRERANRHGANRQRARLAALAMRARATATAFLASLHAAGDTNRGEGDRERALAFTLALSRLILQRLLFHRGAHGNIMTDDGCRI
jgi:hypothetical protein